MKKKITMPLYLCGIDWQHEIGCSGDVLLFENIKKHKKMHGGWRSCGIVKVMATLEERGWPVKQDFSKGTNYHVCSGCDGKGYVKIPKEKKKCGIFKNE